MSFQPHPHLSSSSSGSVQMRENGISNRGGSARVECYVWAEIAVALETDQLSTMSHALPSAQSDEEEDEWKN